MQLYMVRGQHRTMAADAWPVVCSLNGAFLQALFQQPKVEETSDKRRGNPTDDASLSDLRCYVITTSHANMHGLLPAPGSRITCLPAGLAAATPLPSSVRPARKVVISKSLAHRHVDSEWAGNSVGAAHLLSLLQAKQRDAGATSLLVSPPSPPFCSSTSSPGRSRR